MALISCNVILTLVRMTVCPTYKENVSIFNIVQVRTSSINHERMFNNFMEIESMRRFVKTSKTKTASPVKLVD